MMLEGSPLEPAEAEFYGNSMWAEDPHTYTDDQCELLLAGECDEVAWPSEDGVRYFVLQWLGAVAALEESL